MANYITTLKEKTVTLEQENARLMAELEAARGIEPPQTTHPNVVTADDYRNQAVPITYGRGGGNMVSETVPLIEGFTKLVDFYDQFQNPTDRNVPKEVLNQQTASGTKVNQATVYCKMVYRDLHSKQRIETIREMPLWLAVDNQVQQNKQVELISKEEFDAWYKELVMKNRKEDTRYRKALENKIIDQAVNAELAKEASGVNI